MSQPAPSIVECLDDLRHDEQLWEAIHAIEETAAAWKAGLRPSLELVRGHHTAVRAALQVLSENYLARFFQSLDQPAVILLNYQSALSASGEDGIRIADAEPRPLTSHLPETMALVEHVRRVLDREWPHIRKAPNYFQLHRLAQLRVSLPGGSPRRTPVYVSPSPTRPTWADRLKPTNPPGLLHNGQNRPSVALYCPAAPGGITIEGLRVFALGVASHQQQVHRYPDASTSYEGYERYINQLLGWNRGIWLCTVAVSDELTDLPLGTAMIFSEKAPEPEIAARINALCFEVMNAIEKIERLALNLSDTSKALAAWVNHEAKGWFSVLDQQLIQLRRLTRRLFPEVQEATQPEEKPPDVRGQLETIHDRLHDLKTYAPNVIELLNHFTGKEAGQITGGAFREQVSAYIRSKEVAPAVEVAVGDLKIPKALVIIAFEFIRNARKRREVKGGEFTLRVRLSQRFDAVVLEVHSAPHASRHGGRLELCNQHAKDYSAGRLSEFKAAMDRGNKLGHWSVIRMAQAIEAESPAWRVVTRTDGYLSVTASVVWRPGG